jgi:hypothetical protein
MVPAVEQASAFSDNLLDFDFSRIFEDDTDTAVVEPAEASTLVRPQEVPSPPQRNSQEFVNIYMIVDPTTGQMICPQQVLTYQNGAATSTALVGRNFMGWDHTHSSTTRHTIVDQQVLPIQEKITSSRPTQEKNLLNLLSMGVSPRVCSSTGMIQPLKGMPSTASVSSDSQPIRGLSAYNFFFRDERDRLLNGHDEDWSDCKKRQLLQAHWGRDRTKKRRHRKSHGQISFISLSKEISARWKKLTDEHKHFYREVASLDFARFQNETKQMSDGHN